MHHFADETNLFHTSKSVKNLKLVIFKSPRKVIPDDIKIKLSVKTLYPSSSIKHLYVKIDRFLNWQDQVNSIAVKLIRANELLLKIRNYVSMKTLRNIYFAIFDSHLSYSCIVWALNINIVRRFIILQKKAFRIMNFKD